MEKCAREKCENAVLGDVRRLYCSASCQRQALSQRQSALVREQAISLRNGDFLRRHAELLARAERAILKNAPETAVGYLAALPLTETGTEWLAFPEWKPNAKLRQRLDGTRCSLPYFRLRPFEPPRVPQTCDYKVLYVTEQRFIFLEAITVVVSLPGVAMCYGNKKNRRIV